MTLEIYVTGHPRSGNTWLGRLLSDILKAEYITDTTLTSREASYWGEGEPRKDYQVFKTHSRVPLPGPFRTSVTDTNEAKLEKKRLERFG